MKQLLFPSVIMATPDGLVIVVFQDDSDPIQVFVSWDTLQQIMGELTRDIR